MEKIPSFKQHCRSGNVGSILVDAKTLLFVLNFRAVAFDTDSAERSLQHFLSFFPKTKLIFAFPVHGPNDGPNRRSAGNVPSDFTSARFDGIEPQHEHEATQREEMAHYRSRRSALLSGIEISGYDTVFFHEWISHRLWKLGYPVFNIEGINDHSQQLAMMAKDLQCDYVLSTYPDFYLYDMGDTGYVQFHAPYPMGRCPTPVYRANDIVKVLGIPIEGLRELSCILGNHLLRPSVDEPLADWLDQVQRSINGTREDVVKKFFDLTRARWSDGRSYTLVESAAYLHETTGLDVKIMLNALKFYHIGDKKPNGVSVADFPLIGNLEAREAYIDQLGYSDVVTFKETRLRAQYGDSFVRRFHVLERLRSLKYGLMMMSGRECGAAGGALDQLVKSADHIVVEHRVDFGSKTREGDMVRQYIVEAQVPKFTFFAGPGYAVERALLSPEPLFRAFENGDTVEFHARRSFFLNLFGANTGAIVALPEVLQPTAAALRFLMQLDDVAGLDNAVDAFIQHLVVLQHFGQARVVEKSQQNSRHSRPSTVRDEQAFGYFFLIIHVLYTALIEFNSLCNFPYTDIPAFEKLFDYHVFCAIYEQGSGLLNIQEITEAGSLHRAITSGVRKHIKVDLGPHDSVWVPPCSKEASQTARRLSIPFAADTGQGDAPEARPRSIVENREYFSRNWRHRWSMAGHSKILLDANHPPQEAAARRSSVEVIQARVPYAAAKGGNAPRDVHSSPNRTVRGLSQPTAAKSRFSTKAEVSMHWRRSDTSGDRSPQRHHVRQQSQAPPQGLPPPGLQAPPKRPPQGRRPSLAPEDAPLRDVISFRPSVPPRLSRVREKQPPPPTLPPKSTENGPPKSANAEVPKTSVDDVPKTSANAPEASDDEQSKGPQAPMSKVTLITAPDFYAGDTAEDLEPIDRERAFAAVISESAADSPNSSKKREQQMQLATKGKPAVSKVTLITAPDFYDGEDLEPTEDGEREFSATVVKPGERKVSVFDGENVLHSVQFGAAQ